MIIDRLEDVTSYAGDFGNGDYLWPIDFWIKCQRDLVIAETIMRLASFKYKIHFASNIRKMGADWPARRLIIRRALKKYEIRIMLNPNYLQDESVFYLLDKNVMINFGELYKKQIKFETLARYSVEQMSDIKLIARDIERVVEGL